LYLLLTIAASDNILTEKEFRPLKLIYVGRGGRENKHFTFFFKVVIKENRIKTKKKKRKVRKTKNTVDE
jgi:hypothetical protein